jgi:AcrR family transcriptional regulator
MPRAGLTPAIVVEQAADLADEVGYDGLTLALLAARLGVAVPSLYKHVDGLDAVRRGVAILAVAELGEALRSSLDDRAATDPGARLRALATAFRGYATAHPGRYAATVRAAPPGDEEHTVASDAVLATVLEVLAEHGLTGPTAIDAARTLRATLHGFVTLEAAGGFGLPREVDRSFDVAVDALERGLSTIPDRSPPR